MVVGLILIGCVIVLVANAVRGLGTQKKWSALNRDSDDAGIGNHPAIVAPKVTGGCADTFFWLAVVGGGIAIATTWMETLMQR